MRILVVASGNGSKISPFVREQTESLKPLGVEAEYFLIEGKGVFGYARNHFRLRKTLKTGDYDLIHAHYGLSGFVAALQLMKPVVITFHGSDIHRFFNNVISSMAGILARWRVFVSEDLCRKIFIRRGNAWSVIPCGVDLSLFRPCDRELARQKLQLENSRKYVLFASSFDNPVKNYALAKECMGYLRNVELLELSGRSREEVNLLLNACDVLLLTSETEGSPQIVKEAMAVNCPIVSTDVGDVATIIGGTDGCYLAASEPTELAAKVEEAIAFARRTEGRSLIRDYELGQTARDILSVYQKAIGLEPDFGDKKN